MNSVRRAEVNAHVDELGRVDAPFTVSNSEWILALPAKLERNLN